MNAYKKVGILGGMGPESTALLYKQVVRGFQKFHGAKKDSDFPEMVILNLPIPDITEQYGDEELVKKKLSNALSLFNHARVEVVAFPCNTLDYFVYHLRSETANRVLSIVEETATRIHLLGAQDIMLLSTPPTYEHGLYQKHLPDANIVRPKDHHKITELIQHILQGDQPRAEFLNNLRDYTKEYDLVVLACTDLSVLAYGYYHPKVLDSLQCLSDAIIHHATLS